MSYDGHMDGSDWLWMTPMMVLWVVLIGLAVYIAVRLATRSPRRGA